MAFNRKQKMRDNIEAVRTAFTLDRERRTPTERERALLERYCGFGGLKCILNPARELADCRALGEVRPRTVRAYGGTAPNH